jgi:hypothetical protein
LNIPLEVSNVGGLGRCDFARQLARQTSETQSRVERKAFF